MRKVFPAKIDPLVFYILIPSLLIPLLCVYLLPGVPMFVQLLVLALDALILWMLLDCYTFVDTKKLTHKCGPFSWTVQIADIQKILKKARHPMNHGTWSLDKMEIQYRKGKLVIAPKDKDAMISALKEMNDQIEIE